MDNSDPRQRSYLPITRDDLARLLALAQQDRRQFFAKTLDGRPWCAKRIARLDFGNPKFGGSGRGYIGRCVDLLGRALNVPVGADLTESLRGYLKSPKTGTSRELGKKAVLLLEPSMGKIVWPVDGI